MKLSVVTTLYKSCSHINAFYDRMTSHATATFGNDFELIMVNDGSPDDSLDRAVALHQADARITVIDLSRNFGHHKAMMTGLLYSKGDHVFLIDSDLEEAPEWLAEFSDAMKSKHADVVFGVQQSRRGGLRERLTGHCFYALFRWLTGVNQPDNIVTARLMTRRYVDALVTHREREVNIGGLWVTTGFVQVAHSVVKTRQRPTTYSTRAKIAHFVNAVTSFSSLPLVFVFYLGVSISACAALFVAYLVFRYFFIAMPPDGYTSVIASLFLFSGLIISSLGLQGIYISKIFSEVKQRPYTIVRSIYQRQAH